MGRSVIVERQSAMWRSGAVVAAERRITASGRIPASRIEAMAEEQDLFISCHFAPVVERLPIVEMEWIFMLSCVTI